MRAISCRYISAALNQCQALRQFRQFPPKQPFSHTLIAFMASQAGVTVREFYDAMTK